MEYIKMKPAPHCPVCKNKGYILYSHWIDHVLAIPGEWTWKQCVQKDCCTIWQDPTPIEEDIPKLYEHYPTHAEYTEIIPKNTFLQRLRNMVRASYLDIAYGYTSTIPTFLKRILFFVACLHPGWKDIQAASVFYLKEKKDGIVLDIGCGNGSSLRSLEQKGWRGVGIDFDESAVYAARKKGTTAYVGELASHMFEEESFDAIIMSHVIEHLPHPKMVLQECKRILKKNGVLVALTPNANSAGRKRYQEDWRGFEPDHLTLFTMQSLAQIAKEINFTKVEIFSSLQGTDYILTASKKLVAGKPLDVCEKENLIFRIKKQIWWFILSIKHLFNPEEDEVIVLRCYK